MARVADELGELLDRDPEAFIARYRQVAADLEPDDVDALKSSIRTRGRVTPSQSAGLNPKQLVELHRRRVIALREIGEFKQMTFHGTGSSMLDGLARTDGKILPAAELHRRGLAPTTGEGSKFTPVDGHKEFVSVGEGESGFGTSLAYADALQNLAHYNPQLLSDAQLTSHIERLEKIVANFDSVKLEVQGDFRQLAAREKGHFSSELEKLKREVKRRANLPPDSPVRKGGHVTADNHPMLFEFDMRGSNARRERRPLVKPGGPLGGEGSVHGPIDLKRLIRRVYVPAEHVQATEHKLRAILGHGDFEVIAIEAMDGLPDPGMLGSSRVSTYKMLGQLEKEMEAVDRAYEAAMREGRPLDLELLLRERTP